MPMHHLKDQGARTLGCSEGGKENDGGRKRTQGSGAPSIIFRAMVLAVSGPRMILLLLFF